MRPEVAPTFEHDLTKQICLRLTKLFTGSRSFNEFLEEGLSIVREAFEDAKLMLVDYRENTDHFDLLHFEGFSENARFDLQHRLHVMDLRRALKQKDPYETEGDPHRLYIPLYFVETLEAVLVLETAGKIDLTPPRREVAQMVSRFLGLLMSSSRLAINRRDAPDFDDLKRARQIQLSYLPTEYFSTDRYEIYGYNQSSALVGGDYFDYFRSREGSIQCVLADACGHGLSAALIMSTFRGLLHSQVEGRKDFLGLFDRLNQAVHSRGEFVQYLTGVFLDHDETQRVLRYFNAGHYEPLLVRSNGSVQTLPGGGPPLGMFQSARYEMYETPVESEDLIVLFTDGLTDLRDSKDNFFGVEGITGTLSNHRGLPLKDLAKTVLGQAMAFARAQHPEDDLTLFLMRFY